MSQPSKLEANEIQEQARALADHLHQAGVRFVPASHPEHVAAWSQRFEDLEAEMEVSALLPGDPVNGPPKASDDSASVSGANVSATSVPVNGAGGAGKSRPDAPAAVSPAAVPPGRNETESASVAAQGVYGTALPIAQRDQALSALATEVAACTRCEILSSCRTNTVFGEGRSQARFAFFGEGPGAEEDRSGRPFVGRAGELLTKMIAACTLDRSDVFIFNTVKCRPPGNRNPEPDELSNCRSFYQTQLELIQPEYIVCLGAVAAQELLQSKLSVGRLRGKFHRYRASKVLVTYHPAYLLRNESAKKAAWADLQMLMLDSGLKS